MVEDKTKAEEHHKEAVKGINQGAQLGVWGAIIAMFTKMFDFGSNPALQVLTGFFEMFSSRFNASFSELAMMLAETLFSEESKEKIGDMAEKVETVLHWFIECMKYLEQCSTWLESIIPWFYKWWKEWGWIFENLKYGAMNLSQSVINTNLNLGGLNTSFTNMLSSVSSMKSKLADLTDMFDDLLDAI